jgi:regulatory protein
MPFAVFNGEANLRQRIYMPKAKNVKPKAGNIVPGGNDVPRISARVAALKMLARREYSEAQIRQRLIHRGHPSEEIDEAVARLKSDSAIDDARVAKAMARMATVVKGRGKRRVIQQLTQAGIARSTIQRAVADTFDDVDGNQLIEAALAKRLRNGRPIADEKEFLRLYRYLVAQGFDSDQALAALSRRRGA